jgi:hypothetical protein
MRKAAIALTLGFLAYKGLQYYASTIEHFAFDYSQLRAVLAESLLAAPPHCRRHRRAIRGPVSAVVWAAPQASPNPPLDQSGLCQWRPSWRRCGLLSLVLLSAAKFRHSTLRPGRRLVGHRWRGNRGRQAVPDRGAQGVDDSRLCRDVFIRHVSYADRDASVVGGRRRSPRRSSLGQLGGATDRNRSCVAISPIGVIHSRLLAGALSGPIRRVRQQIRHFAGTAGTEANPECSCSLHRERIRVSAGHYRKHQGSFLFFQPYTFCWRGAYALREEFHWPPTIVPPMRSTGARRVAATPKNETFNISQTPYRYQKPLLSPDAVKVAIHQAPRRGMLFASQGGHR